MTGRKGLIVLRILFCEVLVKMFWSLRNKIGTGTYVLNLVVRYIFRINVKAPFPLHYTSRVSFGENIKIMPDGNDKTLFKCLGCSPGLYIQARNGVEIKSSANIAPGVKIISSNHNLSNLREHERSPPIIIAENVWVGANVVILPGAHIGRGAVIGAGSVVTSDVPENTVYCGNPAQFLRKIS